MSEAQLYPQSWPGASSLHVCVAVYIYIISHGWKRNPRTPAIRGTERRSMLYIFSGLYPQLISSLYFHAFNYEIHGKVFLPPYINCESSRDSLGYLINCSWSIPLTTNSVVICMHATKPYVFMTSYGHREKVGLHILFAEP